MKQLFIDARLWGIKHTGIGRYTENLIEKLPSSPDVEITLILTPEDSTDPKLHKFNRVIAKKHPYSPLSQLEMFFIWLRHRPDLLHVTQSSVPIFWFGKMVVTFHDLIKHQSKGLSTTTKNPIFYWLKYLGLISIDFIATLKASFILVPTQYWKDQLLFKYHLPDGKVIVTYEGVDSRIPDSSSDNSLSVTKPYVFYVGNIYPHKNLEVLFQAIKKLQGKIKLAIVCARSVFESRAKDQIKNLNLENDVFFLGRVTDSQLNYLYKNALAFVFPSLIEGFGLPGLEAMSTGTPVIAARASCLPEVYGQSALYFDPHNSEELAKLILKIQKDVTLRNNLIKRGLGQVKNYSWDKMSQQTWKIYQRALP